MGRIRLLSKQLANQIAAGEVVERPSSVVKELLENAIDSGAEEILLEVKSAGKTLIRVRDNGHGIEKDDLPLALCPHATSKIYTLDDLSEIKTLGFRGEALASIASVSRLVLSSRAKDSNDAFSITVEGEQMDPVISPTAHPVGTTVDVSDLFFNTPARRRFLKSDRTEFLRIKDTFIRTALSHPDISFELVSDSKRVLKVGASTDGGLDLKRLKTLIGADYSLSGILVNCEDPCLGISGMILPPPSLEQALSDQIYLFLNGRAIADKVVTHALKEGYFEVIKKTLPLRCVLYLSISPKEVDVNVHPRKDEVRFHEVSKVHDLICGAVVDALKKAGIGEVFQEHSKPDDLSVSEGVKSEDLFKELDDGVCSTDPYQSESALKQSAEPFLQNASIHQSAFNIDDETLPQMPLNVGGIIDLKAVSDRSCPEIVKRERGSSQAYYHDLLSNRNNVSRNISVYKAGVDAGNIVSSASSSNCARDFHSPSYSNGIELLDIISDNLAFVRYEGTYALVKLSPIRLNLIKKTYLNDVSLENVKKKILKLPFSVKLPLEKIKQIKENAHLFSRLGFELNFKKTMVELTAMPEMLSGSDLSALLSKLFILVTEHQQEMAKGECPDEVLTLIASSMSYGHENMDTLSLLQSVKDFENLKALGAVKIIDLKALASEFGE